ncbi:hypothetical protein PsYK624_002570 [Phanerochaete sordida]|uniref:A-kinase anchor protein 7-like phosphoesterase domain-containing protein n=1 Tax=Phanerochaete sordida TaxID=48140 RepID=A0A9P3FX36_9APHY|nr:hypothetical protein PsYK624_002570 [Phanerochaete sordida]
MPLGHHPELRDRVSAFTRALLASAPAVPGLDASIVIAPRRLHLTLGVMSLASPAPAPPPAATTSDASQDAAAPQRTLDAALALLHALAPRVRTLLGGAPLRVALERVDVMRPDGGDPARAHVLWAGPAPGGEGTRVLRRVAEFVSGEFRKAGLVVDERRPLKLHCTVLNTVYRRPRPTSGRAPFSYTALLSTPAFEAIKMRTQEVAEVEREQRQRKTTPVEVNLGEYTVDEIQICEMGSWGPEGEYVSVGSIAL